MTIGAYQPFEAVASAPFSKTIALRSWGQNIGLAGWSAELQLRPYPGAPPVLDLLTASQTANGSGLTIYTTNLTSSSGCVFTLSGLNIVISETDLQLFPVNPVTGWPGDPTDFFYEIFLTDLVPFRRRWLFGPFTLAPE